MKIEKNSIFISDLCKFLEEQNLLLHAQLYQIIQIIKEKIGKKYS